MDEFNVCIYARAYVRVYACVYVCMCVRECVNVNQVQNVLIFKNR